jgi:hypothetical protein
MPRPRNYVSGQLLFIRKRFVITVSSLVNKEFFEHSESKEQFGRLTADSFDRRVGAAYDLRSKYVHAGIPFGGQVLRAAAIGAETQIGAPIVSDREFSKILALAPTLLGLERIVRYCLLRFAEENGGYLAS